MSCILSVLCCWFVLLFCLLLLFSFSYFTDVHTWFHSSNHHTCSRSPINHSPSKSPLFVSRLVAFGLSCGRALIGCFWVELWQSSGWALIGCFWVELWQSSGWALIGLLGCLLVYWFIVSFNTFVKLCYLSCQQPTFVLSLSLLNVFVVRTGTMRTGKILRGLHIT